MSFIYQIAPISNIIIAICAFLTILIYLDFLSKIKLYLGKSISYTFRFFLLAYLGSFLASLAFYLLFFALPPVNKNQVIMLRSLIQLFIILSLIFYSMGALMLSKTVYEYHKDIKIFYGIIVFVIINLFISAFDFIFLYNEKTDPYNILSIVRVFTNFILMFFSSILLFSSIKVFRELKFYKPLFLYAISLLSIFIVGTIVYQTLAPIYISNEFTYSELSIYRVIIVSFLALILSMNYLVALFSIISLLRLPPKDIFSPKEE